MAARIRIGRCVRCNVGYTWPRWHHRSLRDGIRCPVCALELVRTTLDFEGPWRELLEAEKLAEGMRAKLGDDAGGAAAEDVLRQVDRQHPLRLDELGDVDETDAPIAVAGEDADELRASRIVRRLEIVWHTLRAEYNDIPEAVIVVASGGDRRGNWRKAGHYASSRWTRTDGAGRRSEVLIAGEVLAEAPADILEVLLHEAAHGVADARGIQDCSNRGRYHNEAYRRIAGELGLEVAKDKTYGWTLTKCSAATLERFASVLELLRFGARRLAEDEAQGTATGNAGDESGEGDGSGETTEAEPKEKGRIRIACRCAEPRILRLSRKVAIVAPIDCRACGMAFGGDELDEALRAHAATLEPDDLERLALTWELPPLLLAPASEE